MIQTGTATRLGPSAIATSDGPFALTIEDLRFFVTCYLGGLVFFLVMLS